MRVPGQGQRFLPLVVRYEAELGDVGGGDLGDELFQETRQIYATDEDTSLSLADPAMHAH